MLTSTVHRVRALNYAASTKERREIQTQPSKLVTFHWLVRNAAICNKVGVQPCATDNDKKENLTRDAACFEWDLASICLGVCFLTGQRKKTLGYV